MVAWEDFFILNKYLLSYLGGVGGWGEQRNGDSILERFTNLSFDLWAARPSSLHKHCEYQKISDTGVATFFYYIFIPLPTIEEMRGPHTQFLGFKWIASAVDVWSKAVND